MQCIACDASKDIDRLPMGWKRIEESVYCKDCWRARYVLRAITLPVVSSLDGDWKDLWDCLGSLWRQAAQLSNWAMSIWFSEDPAHGADRAGKIPGYKPRYLYPEARQQWPDMPTSAVVSLLNSAQKKYRACRFDVVWRRSTSLPSFRADKIPLPIHNATWKASFDTFGGGEEGEKVCPVVSLALEPGRGKRLRLRLKGGPNYRWQLSGFRKIVDGRAVQGELAIYPDTKRSSDRTRWRLLVKCVAWFPNESLAAKATTMAGLHTGGDAFLTMLHQDDPAQRVFRWNRDDVCRAIAAQDDQMQRLREDLKAEKRLGKERDGIMARMDLLRQKHRDYLHTLCHQASAQVVNMLRRRRCAMLVYVDADKSYLPRFPWHKLRTMLEDKASKAGINLVSSGDVARESA